jgi:hypothetical protein
VKKKMLQLASYGSFALFSWDTNVVVLWQYRNASICSWKKAGVSGLWQIF